MRGVHVGREPRVIYVGTFIDDCKHGIHVADETPDAREVANRDLPHLALTLQLPKAPPTMCKWDNQAYARVCRLDPLPERVGFARYARAPAIRYPYWLEQTMMENFVQTAGEMLDVAGEVGQAGLAFIILSIPVGLVDSMWKASLRKKWSPCLTRLQQVLDRIDREATVTQAAIKEVENLRSVAEVLTPGFDLLNQTQARGLPYLVEILPTRFALQEADSSFSLVANSRTIVWDVPNRATLLTLSLQAKGRGHDPTDFCKMPEIELQREIKDILDTLGRRLITKIRGK